MTSASELFYNRRSRLGRSSLDLGLNSSLDRSFHHHSHSNRRHNHQQNNNNNNNNRRNRHDLDGCDPLRRPPLVRHQSHRPNLERDAVRLNEGSSPSSLGSNVNLDNSGGIHNSPRFSGHSRLPGAVLLARERLLQRLRGVYLPGNRRSNGASSDINRNDLTLGNEFRLVDAGDWETEIPREWFSGGTPFTDSVSQRELLLVPQQTSTRPLGLTQEAMNNLQVEVFGTTKCSDEKDTSGALQECSICLESFLVGDELKCLPCAHRFHSSCLDPWIRTCGDCPYCRSSIIVTNCTEQ
ncbi:probable E3 ubiquitin-protein ligase RHY1A [Actinidia eriantha]|uniref:probable E3 ubiquitin-protein ligase RHY1A n=1 Tax=Actinidia eriantha TaxID=165200 RepID=UPI00258507E1|nr:probable E3 ubiquitin-protein ligase RHY1A [Actinidia eriantha]